MTSEDLEHIVHTNPALQMLRLQNAKWFLPFLFKSFKEAGRFSIDEKLLVQLLSETLSGHADDVEDAEEAGIIFGENEELRSRKYIGRWVKERILQDFTDAQGLIQFQLSSHTERVFQWLTALQNRHHVGTESRFKLLFNSLRDIVEHTEGNARKRLELLKDKKAEIEKEIKAIELGRTPDSYNNAQVQERLDLFTRLCYELVGDFREVEDNFRQIHRSIVTHHTKAEKHKGAIVGYAFQAYDELRNSSQGKSFYAFWDFLISRAGQEEWTELTEQLLGMLQDRQIEADDAFIANIKSMLLQQGRNVYEANDKMAEKLSRIISEKEIERHRRLHRQINGIKELVFDLMERDDVPCGIQIEGGAEIKMPMDRKLQMAPRQAPGVVAQPSQASQTIADPERFSRLLNTAFIDKKKLWQKVQKALAAQGVLSLKEVLELQPLEHGLAEVVSYFSFLREHAAKTNTVPGATELIPLNEERTKFVEVPYLMFNA